MNTTSPRRRRGVRTIGAFGTVALSAGLALVAPGVAAAAESVTDGDLSWGVLERFRSYVTGPIAQGSITPSAGATAEDDGTFTFSGGTGTVDGSDVAAGFDGQLFFTGHHGALEITMSDLRIDITGTAGHVVADVVSKDMSTGSPVTYDDVELVDLDLTGITPATTATGYSWSAIPGVLTEEGAPAFGGFYSAGEVMDPVSFTVDTEAGDPDPDPDPPAADEQDLSVVVPEVDEEPEPGAFAWSITGDGSAVSLGTAQLVNGRLVAAGEIKPVVVSDTRTTANQWSITAQVSDFTSGGTTVAGSHLGWTPKVVSAGGDAVAGPAVASGITAGDGLASPAVLGSAANGHAAGSTTLGADLDLRLPSTTAAGTYGATLTLTALS
jgi:Htaa